ncbi:alpha-rhamnosidase [Clostridia bacterium]|nr:alpha-rhamnosidase [Clostridia bacterium]
MLKITDLKTEYLTQPLGLETRKPRFSWRAETDAAFTQNTYRIFVATAPDLLSGGKADKWDSGVVASDAQTGVEYGGKPLKSRERCYWKAVVNGAESEAARFEIGLLNRSDWYGEWVSAQASRIGGSLLFLKQFVIPSDKRVKRARAYVCGLGCHEVYVNGKKSGDAVLNPAVTDYAKRVLYCVYELDRELLPGKNAFGVAVGNGWLGGRKLLAQVHIDFTDGTDLVFCTANCGGWWVTGAPIVADSIYDGEVFDGRIAGKLAGWCNPDYDADWATGWMYCMLTDAPQGKLTYQAFEPIRVMGEYTPVGITAHGNNKVYDLGQVFSGYAKIKVKGAEGAKVTLLYGEQLTGRGGVNQLNLRTAKARDLYILNGTGVEEYCPRFTYHGFRYVEAVIEGVAEITELTGQYVRSSAEKVGAFSCSDEILNRLHENAVMTEGSTLHGVMTDCPQRDERFGWLNDLSSRIYQSVNNYSMTGIYAKTVADITDTQDAEGRIADTAPFFTGFRPADPVSVCYLLLGLFNYKYYGDKATIENNYDGYKAWVEYLTGQTAEDGAALYSRYADWCPPGNYSGTDDPANYTTPGEYVSALYYFWHLQCMARAAEITGNDSDCSKYKKLAEKTFRAIDKKYYDGHKGIYATGSQSAHALALNFGLAAGEKAEELAQRLNGDIVSMNYHAYTGNQAYRHLFDALTKYGYADTVHKLLINPEYPGWGYMVACGATTVWERWEVEMQQKMHSFCHPMFASYDAWFFNSVLGINAAEDAVGMNKLIIKPVIPSGLTHAEGSVKTVRGEVSCAWRKEGAYISFDIVIPPNTDAEILIENVCGVNGRSAGGGTPVSVIGGGRISVKARGKMAEEREAVS